MLDISENQDRLMKQNICVSIFEKKKKNKVSKFNILTKKSKTKLAFVKEKIIKFEGRN